MNQHSSKDKGKHMIRRRIMLRKGCEYEQKRNELKEGKNKKNERKKSKNMKGTMKEHRNKSKSENQEKEKNSEC